MRVIGLLHAYSRANAGDSLLVDLTMQRLRRLGVRSDDVVVVALDPASFADLPHVVGWGTPGRELDLRSVRALTASVRAVVRSWAGHTNRGVSLGIDDCDAFVAVGGGYLRSPGLRPSVGVALNHLPQLVAAAHVDVPTIYLPQSIGPLPGPVGGLIRRELGRIDRVWLRDDTSMQELEDCVPGAARCPDLAVLAVTGANPRQAGPDRRVVLVGRDLDHVPAVGATLLAVADLIGDRASWAVQAAGDDSKSDWAFYAKLGVSSAGSLHEALQAAAPGAVVSVRLHGAIMAMLAGVPAVHLAYDRKGPAAYADLGLDRYCLDVRSAAPDHVVQLIEELCDDSSAYWDSVSGCFDSLQRSSLRLDAELSTVFNGLS